MRKAQFLVSALLLFLLLMACAPKAAPAPASAPAPALQPPAPAPAVTAKLAWQEKWETVLTAAKKEGSVVIYASGTSAAVRNARIKIMRMQGIRAEMTISPTMQNYEKITTERRAGLYLVDILTGGPSPQYRIARPNGWLQPMDAALILPDVADPERMKKVWYEGEFPWIDQEHTIFQTTLTPQMTLAINTSLVKEGEIKSYRDSLDPKWKGKILVGDPTTAGAAQNGFMVVQGIMGTDFLRELAKMEPVVLKDERQALDWLAHGKMAIVVFPSTTILAEAYDAGAPVTSVVPKEGTYLSGGANATSWMKDSPHPNAAKVYLNMITSKEGQEIEAPAGGSHSLRLDVSTAHLRPFEKRQPGVEYYPAHTIEGFMRRDVTDPLAKEILGPLKK